MFNHFRIVFWKIDVSDPKESKCIKAAVFQNRQIDKFFVSIELHFLTVDGK